ncbi:MAG: M20 aminoacylase family protein [Thermodesulfobacteriota bacterium]
MEIISEINNAKLELREWRRYLHQIPETAFEEVQTAGFVAQKLKEFGLEVHEKIAETGVVGILRKGTGNKSIGFRADMDALPIEEKNRFSYTSRNPGKMHACGHDGHTVMLLAAARHLALYGKFDGTISFIFQPAEENEGGARRMIQEGLFEKFPVNAVYGLHNYPGLEVGKAAVRTGGIMASFDTFDLKITGVGTHGAMPHKGIDPIVVGAEVVGALQKIVSRATDPLLPIVLSVTRFQAGTTYNIIPESARLAGSVRLTTPELLGQIEKKFKQICQGVCQAHGAKVDITYEHRYPPVVNTPDETNLAVKAANLVLSDENVDTNCPPLMGSEDFAWLMTSTPGSYILLGNGKGDKGGVMPHNPQYDFNDELLPVGASYWIRLAEMSLTF